MKDPPRTPQGHPRTPRTPKDLTRKPRDPPRDFEGSQGDPNALSRNRKDSPRPQHGPPRHPLEILREPSLVSSLVLKRMVSMG